MDTIQKQLKMPNKFVDKFYRTIKKTGKAMIKPGVFRGVITVDEFEAVLDAMIEKYVLCPQCRLPEWFGGVCAACGFSGK